MKSGQSEITLPCSRLAAFAAVLLDDLAEWSGAEVEIAFKREAARSAYGFHLGKGEVAPFLFMADDVAEE